MSKELAKTYNPKEIEDKTYEKWCENKYFHAEIDRSRKPFTTVMPPPNITGKLHMGHALDNTLQDILIRYKRMEGYNALWIPGTDHAAISTEVKVTNQLKEEGIDKKELGREGFLERTWQWKEEYAGTIENQLKNVKILDESEIGTESVHIGSTVKVKDMEDGSVLTYRIVGSTESDPLGGRISDESPVGKALLGHEVGDQVEVGCNSVLNPGTVIGRDTHVYPVSSVRGAVPPAIIYKKEGVIVPRK